MRLTYTLDLADYKAAQRLHVRRKASRRVAFAIWYFLTPAIAVLGIAAFILLDLHRITPTWAPILFGLEAALVWISICMPVSRAYRLRKGFSQLFPPGRSDRNSSIDIDEDRIISAIPGVSEGKFFWNAIIDWDQDELITLFYIGPKRFLFVPTRAFGYEERAELLRLLERKNIEQSC